jgi:outer membrane usher protein
MHHHPQATGPLPRCGTRLHERIGGAHLRRCLVLVLLLQGLGLTMAQVREPATAGRASAGPAASSAPRLMPVEVMLNGANVGNWLLLHTTEGFHAPREALDAWRVSPPNGADRLKFQQENWYALSAIEGYDAKFDPARQALELRLAPTAFLTTRVVDAEQESPPVSTAEPAAFFNYDMSWNHSRTRGMRPSKELGALTEAGFTSALGVLTSSFLGRHVQSADFGTSAQWRRLETTFTRDLPEHKLSLRLGDTISRSGLIGRPFYFGGIQIGRNFDLAPGFISQPLPLFAGSSSVPSTVELYINDALRQTLNVPAGPFTIENPMPISGDGRARLVVRDALGRESVITQSFFSSGELLEDGLSDWSLELGAVRNGLGLTNADYGERFAAGLWRQGLSKRLTMEVRGEWGQQTRGLGMGFSLALPWQALGQASLAASEHEALGRGLQWSIGTEFGNARQAFSLNVQGATAAYRTVGLNDSMPPPQWQLAGSFSHTHERLGTFGLGLAVLQSRQQGRLDTYSLSHTVRVGPLGALSTVLTRVQGASSGTLFAVSLTWPLDRQINTSSHVMHRSGQTDAYASASQGLRGDTGLGWRALGGSRNGSALAEGGAYLQSASNLFTADVGTSSAQQTMRLGTQGGLVLMGGRAFATRPVRDSFALVTVPGLADVGVNFQGREGARTDSSGVALVTGLQPYSTNQVRLNPSDLPLSAEIDSLEQVVVPRRRSAVTIGFAVRNGQAALITVRLPDGQPAPVGAEIEVPGDERRFPVGRGGQAFLTGLQTRHLLRLHWKGRSCQMPLALTPTAADDIARPAPLLCEGVLP